MKIRRKLDEYGMLVPNEFELKFYGGGGGKGSGGVMKQMYDQQTALAAPAAATSVSTSVAPVTEAVTQDISGTPEEEAKKLKAANKYGAKSLQIPLTGASSGISDATKAVGTI